MKFRWLHRGVLNFKIGLLYIKHLISVRPLELVSFELGRENIRDQWRTILSWKVKGCNRIQIEGYGMFPGNIRAVSIKPSDKKSYLVITYIGVFDRIIHQIPISAEDKNLVRQFSVAVQSFPVVPVPPRIQQIIPAITHSYLKLEEVDFSLHFSIHPSADEYLNICPINQKNQ